LDLMLAVDGDVVAINYPLKQAPDHLCCGYVFGELIWVGLGCTLVKREVFEALEQPWFQTDCTLVTRHHAKGCGGADWEIGLQRGPRPYGGQDLFFCFNAWNQGYSINLVEGVLCDHLSH
jgi:hypothetical protein